MGRSRSGHFCHLIFYRSPSFTKSHHMMENFAPMQGQYFLYGMDAGQHTQMLAVNNQCCHIGASWLNISPAAVSVFLNRSQLFIVIGSIHI